MITEDQYKEALNTVSLYRKQLSLSVFNGCSSFNIYEWLKSEMFAGTDITEEEFEEILEIWINIKAKKHGNI